jgi:hypothetical protein
MWSHFHRMPAFANTDGISKRITATVRPPALVITEGEASGDD